MVIAAGRLLAERLTYVTFRSGNANGTDTAFAEEITAVAPDRMEYIITNPGMGRKRRHPLARFVSLDQIPKTQEQSLDQCTITASPDTHRLVQACRERNGVGLLAAKAKYLLRDTLKVIGAAELNLEPATAGLFYVNDSDPLSGGTGHTIRVCLQNNVPAVMQSIWRKWINTF